MEFGGAKRLFLSRIYFILLFCNQAFCITLDNNGGYNILLTLDDRIGPDSVENIEVYLDNIKTILQDLSTQLHNSTVGRFHLNSVDLLVPSGWRVAPTHELEYISEPELRYEKADLRVSRSAIHPLVGNHEVCGQPGSYLEIPWEFFSALENDEYGRTSKILTSMWAQYRFGVFEENGHESDNNFPYFHKLSPNSKWEPTGCSYGNLTGVFKDIDQVNAETCDPDSDSPMKPSCRFIPEETSSVSSSLLHLHWLSRVINFCDERTHNQLAPNRHNDLCKHKSVWEVINGTEEFKIVKQPVNTPPPIKFRFMQQAPLFYLLLDADIYEETEPIIRQIREKLFSLFSVSTTEADSLPGYAFSAVGVYPMSPLHVFPTVKDLVNWTKVADNEDAFKEAAGLVSGGEPLNRYSRALKEVVEKIHARNHASGGIILVLKNGRNLRYPFADDVSEEELIVLMKRDRIVLNSIEVEVPGDWETVNLVNMARETGGASFVVNVNEEINSTLTSVQNTISRVLELVWNYKSEINSNYYIMHNAWFFGNPVNITTRKAMSSVLVSFTAPDSEYIDFQLGAYTMDQFDRRFEWNNSDPATGYYSRVVYSIHLNPPKDEELEFRCEFCMAYQLVAYGLYTADEYLKDLLDVKISTNAVNGELIIWRDGPLAIYARIFQGGVPITHLTVKGTLSYSIYLADVTMRDDGITPDLAANDGIYSGYFYSNPLNSSVNWIRVTVSNENKNMYAFPAPIGLLRKDQMFPVAKSANGSVGVQNFQEDIRIDCTFEEFYWALPEKVRTLSVLTREGLKAAVRFTPPRIIIWDVESEMFADGYILKSSTSLRRLVDNFDEAYTVVEINDINIRSPVEIEFDVTQAELQYYAVKTTYNGRQSEVSNVVVLNITTTITTTTPSPSWRNQPFGCIYVYLALALRFVNL